MFTSTEYEEKVSSRIPAHRVHWLTMIAQGYVIDAKLDHLASGFDLAEKLRHAK